jgi:hypothetical protein
LKKKWLLEFKNKLVFPIIKNKNQKINYIILMDHSLEEDYTNNYSFNDDDLNELDDFLHYHSDRIYEIYQDLKNRFRFCPFFLAKMQYYHIVHFLADIILYNNTEYLCKDSQLTKRFHNCYQNEIDISYQILASFLKRNFKRKFNYYDWLDFCITLSDRYEVHKRI